MKHFILILFVTISSFTFATDCADASFPNPTDPAISVFPNPTSQYFQISNSFEIKQIVIYNLFGSKVKTFIHQPGTRYDIVDLPNGMYLIQFVGENKAILTTKRLSKR